MWVVQNRLSGFFADRWTQTGAAASCTDEAAFLTVASSVAAGCTSHPFDCTGCTDSATSARKGQGYGSDGWGLAGGTIPEP